MLCHNKSMQDNLTKKKKTKKKKKNKHILNENGQIIIYTFT